MKIAIPTKNHMKLKDEVSDVFARAKTFTIIEVEDKEIKSIKVVDNPVLNYAFGVGPIIVKMLEDMKVDLVITSQIGFGISQLLQQRNIRYMTVKAQTKVEDALKEIIK